MVKREVFFFFFGNICKLQVYVGEVRCFYIDRKYLLCYIYLSRWECLLTSDVYVLY